jgi:hypothetical protein
MSKSLFEYFRLDGFCPAEVMTEQKLNSIVSDLEILKMQKSELVEKIDCLLTYNVVNQTLSQDREIDLGVLRVGLCKQIDQITEVMKKI